MHDDEGPVRPEPEEPEGYWTEARWERFMLENERLMDRYEKVWRDNPGKDWKDQLDLYYKVHYDLDAPEEKEAEPGDVSTVPSEPEEEERDAPAPEPTERELDDFRQIPVYQAAFEFAHGALDYMKRFEHEERGQNPLREQFCLHALRIAADIAGGHGMGYEEDVLCGNIVKNRWALSHTVEAKRLLSQLAQRDGMTPELGALEVQLLPIINALEERIASLRVRVWWSR